MAAPLLPHPAFGADHQCLERVLRPERKKIAPQFTGPFASRHNGASWDPASRVVIQGQPERHGE